MARLRLIGILVIILAGVIAETRQAEAFEPNPDYWYTETFTLGEVELPERVTISTSDPATTPRGYLLLENRSDKLLFVLSLHYKDVLVMTTPDPNWESRVNGAHEVASYLVAPGRPAVLDMEKLSDLDQDMVDSNVLDYELPEQNVPIPAPQNSALLLVYDGQVIEVPFTISYAPNTQFDNGSEANERWMKSAEATISASIKETQQAEADAIRLEEGKSIGLGLLLVIGLSILGWVVWRAVARRKAKTRAQ